MKSERYYIFVKTTKTRWDKTTMFQVKDKQTNKVIKEFGTMSGARDCKEELNNG